MKKLFFIRHSKAIPNGSCNDFDRPLNEKGIANTHLMSDVLLKQKIKPQLVISSPAIRAVSTAIIMCNDLKFPLNQLILEPILYESTVQHYLNVIQKTNNTIETLFLFAHNPTITEVCNIFSNTSIEHVPTSGVVGLSIDIDDWEKINKTKSSLLVYDFPR